MVQAVTIWINVNKHVIAANAKHGRNDPPIRISKGKTGKPTYAHEVAWDGPSRIVYDAGKPVLKCGARLAIAVEGEVRVVR